MVKRLEHAGELVVYGPDKVVFFGNGGGKEYRGEFREWYIRIIRWPEYKDCAKPWQGKRRKMI